MLTEGEMSSFRTLDEASIENEVKGTVGIVL